MRLLPVAVVSLACTLGCQLSNSTTVDNTPVLYKTVGAIQPPEGFKAQVTDSNSYTFWLRSLPIKKDKNVYLYDGSLKRNQHAQFAVLDISVGDKDLQQCADAVIRLRAEYLYSQRRFDEINFLATSGQEIAYARWRKGERFTLRGNRLQSYQLESWSNIEERKGFDSYLEWVFMYAGTLSLAQQLKKKNDFYAIQAGDVLLQGGSPGHAMQVMNIAVNEKGEKVYLLAQSYMPAQSIHIVKNPMTIAAGAWYTVREGRTSIQTPEWQFTKEQLYSW